MIIQSFGGSVQMFCLSVWYLSWVKSSFSSHKRVSRFKTQRATSRNAKILCLTKTSILWCTWDTSRILIETPAEEVFIMLAHLSIWCAFAKENRVLIVYLKKNCDIQEPWDLESFADRYVTTNVPKLLFSKSVIDMDNQTGTWGWHALVVAE